MRCLEQFSDMQIKVDLSPQTNIEEHFVCQSIMNQRINISNLDQSSQVTLSIKNPGSKLKILKTNNLGITQAKAKNNEVIKIIHKCLDILILKKSIPTTYTKSFIIIKLFYFRMGSD